MSGMLLCPSIPTSWGLPEVRAEQWFLQSRLVHSRLLHGWITHGILDVVISVLPFVQRRMHSSYLTCLGYRNWSVLLLCQICELLLWVDGIYFSQSLVVGLRLLWDLQVVPLPIPVLWMSRGWCQGQFLDLVWLANNLSLLLPGTCDEGLVGTGFCFYHRNPYPLLWYRYLQ